MQLTEDQLKQIEALCRAMPVSRMVDYGMPRELADFAHRLVRDGAPWDQVLQQLALEQETRARAEEDPAFARDAWHVAATSMIFAQMAFNADDERKRSLYSQMTRYFTRFASLSEFQVSRIEKSYRDGTLFGWHFHASSETSGTVIVFGGMSGWSTAYRSMAEALCRHGVDCLLVDGPGQGDSRLEGGLFADADVHAGFGRFIDYALEYCTPGRPVGIWGNSFGGLFAALTAVRDRRISACCINGAPARADIPPFRTAQQQLAAMFGVGDATELTSVLPSLAFDAQRAPLTCATLVLEGGADPLVPAGTQRSFLDGNRHPLSRVETWPDGEHTIYNHSAARNTLAAAWFAAAFGAPAT
jgi:alpha-beta hydrolase superfamily lysophospholipase